MQNPLAPFNSILYRNLNVAEDDDLGKDADEDAAHIISGLHCKVVVQFESYRDFYNTLKVLCCRSLQKVKGFSKLFCSSFGGITGFEYLALHNLLLGLIIELLSTIGW